ALRRGVGAGLREAHRAERPLLAGAGAVALAVGAARALQRRGAPALGHEPRADGSTRPIGLPGERARASEAAAGARVVAAEAVDAEVSGALVVRPAAGALRLLQRARSTRAARAVLARRALRVHRAAREARAARARVGRASRGASAAAVAEAVAALGVG